MTPARPPHGIARCTRYRRRANVAVGVAHPSRRQRPDPCDRSLVRLASIPWSVLLGRR